MSGRKYLVIALAAIFVVASLLTVACGSDTAAKQKLSDALTVVEQDIQQLTATFSSGQGTGAQIKQAITAVQPHWQAVIDACKGVKGADAAKAQQVWNDVQSAVTALPDNAGLTQMAALLGPVQALTAFEQQLRALVGSGTPTTVGGGMTPTTATGAGY
jgi:hypothetical protein